MSTLGSRYGFFYITKVGKNCKPNHFVILPLAIFICYQEIIYCDGNCMTSQCYVDVGMKSNFCKCRKKVEKNMRGSMWL